MRRKYRAPAFIAVLLCAALVFVWAQQSSPVGNWGTDMSYLNIRPNHSYEARFSGATISGSWRIVGKQLIFSPSIYGDYEKLAVTWEKSDEGLVLHESDSNRPLIFAAR